MTERAESIVNSANTAATPSSFCIENRELLLGGCPGVTLTVTLRAFVQVTCVKGHERDDTAHQPQHDSRSYIKPCAVMHRGPFAITRDKTTMQE